MKKRYLLMLILGLATTLVSGQFPDYPFIYAEGIGSVEVPPDYATVSFEVKSTGEESKSVAEHVEQRTARIVNFLLENGVEEKDISSFALEKEPMREDGGYNVTQITGYEISQRLRVTITKLEFFSEIITELLETEDVFGVDSDFDRTDRKKIELELMKKASLDAKEKANAMAEGFDIKLGKVVAVTSSNASNIFRDLKIVMQNFSFHPPALTTMPRVLYVPSVINIKQRISVLYEIEE